MQHSHVSSTDSLRRKLARPFLSSAIALLIFVAAWATPDQARATVELTGWDVGRSNGTNTFPPIQPDPQTQAAADLPTHDSTVGTLPGQAGVSGGAATYSVPIEVPPGRAGMQPSLSLNYSSRAGDGPLGLGWSIGGLSAIHRCPQTPEQDGKAQGVSYSATEDRLCLDGQRLVVVSGSYGAQGAEYRTEVESFARITQLGGNLGSADTAQFKVEQKSGQIAYYGRTAQSRVRPQGAPASLSWLVDGIQDRVGNSQTYNYWSPSSPNYGEVLLSSVTYTGFGVDPGNRAVNFHYGPRSLVPGASDIASSYLAGGLTMQTQLLTSVDTTVGGIKIRVTTPGYSVSAYSGRVTLTSLSDCAPTAAGVCNASNTRPATTFALIDGAFDYRPAPLSAAIGAGANSSSASLTSIRAFGDLDGDGAREMVISEQVGATPHSYLAQLTGNRTANPVVDIADLKVSCLSDGCVGDFLGSGRTSILQGPESAATAQVLRIGSWALGRGQVAQTGQTVLAWTSTNIPYAYATGGISGALAYDFNGDGRLDIGLIKQSGCGANVGLYVYLDTGKVAGVETYTLPAAPLFCTNSTSEFIDHIADLDGDNLPDVVLTNSVPQPNQSPNVIFSRAVFVKRNGSALTTLAKSCTDLGLLDNDANNEDDCHWSNHGAAVHWMDVNGDGLEDFVIATRSHPSWQIRLNSGGHFQTKMDTGSAAGLQNEGDVDFRYASRAPMMDVDGDGKPELLVVSATREAALKMCSIATVPANAQGECPDGTSPVETDVVDAQGCAFYACPEDPRADIPGQGLPPRTNGFGTYNGHVFAGLYGKHFGDIDSSTYHLAALKFVQTGAASFSAQTTETDLVSELGATPRSVEDLFGDGLSDLVSPIGCTRNPQTFDVPGGGSVTYPGCIVMDDATYGVPNIDLYPSLTSTSTSAVATATFADNYKTYVSQNYGAKPAGASKAMLDAASAATQHMVKVDNGNPPPMPALPDLLSLSVNGIGDMAVWGHLPLSFPAVQDGLALYAPLPQSNGYSDDRHFYFQSTMPVVSGFAQSAGFRIYANGQNLARCTNPLAQSCFPQLAGARSAVFGYGEAMYNHFGRGFQGFHTIVSETAVDEATPEDWVRRTRTTTTYAQKFPLTGQVLSSVVTKQNTTTKISEAITTWRCASRTTTNYTSPLSRAGAAVCPGESGTPASGTVYFPFVDTAVANRYDPANGSLVAHTTTLNAGGSAATASGWSQYGNLETQSITVSDDGSPTLKDLTSHVTTNTATYAPDASLWWLDKLTDTSVSRSVAYDATNHPLPASASAPNQTISTHYAWNDDRTPKTKQMQDGIANQDSTIGYCYPPTTNAMVSGCPAAAVGSTSYGLPTQTVVTLAGVGSALSPTRISKFSYTKDGVNAANDGYFLLTSTNPLAQTTTTTVSTRDGQVLKTTDPNGVRTTNTYDVFGYVTQVQATDKNGASIGSPVNRALTRCSNYTCPAGVAEDANQLSVAWRATSVQAGHPTSVTWYDVLGRPIKQASGGFDLKFSATLTEYDALGTAELQSTPYKVTVDTPALLTTDYDVVGRPTLKLLTGSSLDGTHGDERREYAYSSRTTTVTVRAGNVALSGGNCPANAANLCFKVSRRANALGQIMRVTDAGNGVTEYWPDAGGPLVSMKDGDGNITSASFDALGRRTQSVDPDQGTWTATYDPLGELLTQTDARNVVTTVDARDALGRVTSQTTLPPASAVSGLSPSVFKDTFVFDPTNGVGQLGTATRRRGLDRATPANNPVTWTQSTTYDPAARPLTTSSAITEGGTTSLAYAQTYDTYNRPDTLTYPSALRVQNTYATYGQPSTLVNADTQDLYWNVNAVDAWGHVTEDSDANSVLGHFSFDADTGQSTGRNWTQNGNPLTAVTYSYDSFANLKTQVRSGNTETYAYDTRQRLTSTTRTVGGVVNYAYAASGNITKKSDYSTDVAAAYTYAAANTTTSGCGPHAANSVALAAGGTATFTCDANGNVIGGSTLTALIAADDHPIQMLRAGVGGTPDSSCTGAAADRLFCSGFQTFIAGTGGGTVTWAYASDGSKVFEQSSVGSVYFGLHGYEKVGTTHRHNLGPVIVTRIGATDTVTTVLADRLGSTLATVDGTTPTQRAYDPFGAVRNGDMTTKADGKLALPRTLHGFTQHEHVDDVRLIHMGGRVFDPALGRFLSVDPVIQSPTNSQSLNPYSYVFNNPFVGTDPTGYASCSMDDSASCLLKDDGVNKVVDGKGNTVATVIVASKGEEISANLSNGSSFAATFTGKSGEITGALTGKGASSIGEISQRTRGTLEGLAVGTGIGPDAKRSSIVDVKAAEDLQHQIADDRAHFAWTAAHEGLEAVPILPIENAFHTAQGVYNEYQTTGGISLDTAGVLVIGTMASIMGVPYRGVGIASEASILREPTLQQINPRNLIPTQSLREISGSQVNRIRRNMRANGFDQNKPVDALKRKDGRLEIQDGHHRTLAAKKENLEKIPVRVWEEE